MVTHRIQDLARGKRVSPYPDVVYRTTIGSLAMGGSVVEEEAKSGLAVWGNEG